MAKTTSRARSDRRDHPDGTLVLLDAAGTTVQVVPREVCEQIRLMVGRLRLIDGGDVPARVGLISSIGGEGVTTLARCLGLVLSNDLGRTVCIVDLNWWSPAPWTNDDETRGGVAEVIAAGAPLDAVLVETGNAGLAFLPAGRSALSERPLLSNSEALGTVLDELGERFDHVILDLPSVAASSDAVTLADRAGNVLLVVQQGAATDADIQAAVDRIGAVTLLGSVLNRHASRLPAFVRRRIPGA